MANTGESFRMDWITRVPVTRADYYGPERIGRMGSIRPLRVTRASVHTDQVEAGRVTISLGRADGDPYGVEVDLAAIDCRKLAELLVAAAHHVDVEGGPRDF